MEHDDTAALNLEAFVYRLTNLKKEAEGIIEHISSVDSNETTTTGILEELLRKYRGQAGVETSVRAVSTPEYGVSRIISLLADLPVLEFWLYRKAGMEKKASFPPLPANTIFQRAANPLRRMQRVAALYRSTYRRMPLEQLINEQTDKIKTLLSILSESKRVSDNLYEELYNRHIEMQEDAFRAQQHITKIAKYVNEVEQVNEISRDLKFDPKSEEGLNISTLTTYIHKYSGPITEFHDDCNATVNWLFETQQSYHSFENMMSNYSRMINSIRRRTSNLQIYITDFNRIAARLKEGQEVTQELQRSMVALTAGVYATTNQIEEGVHQMIGTYGTLESLQLPTYVNQILSGPLSDVMEANRMLNAPSPLSVAFESAPPELEKGKKV